MTTENPTPNLPLTRAQREKLKAGECPGLTGNGTCPVEKDDVIRVAANLEIRVVRVDPNAGGWKLHYEVRDRRDPVRLVRRTPPVVVPRSDDHPNADVVKQAAQESGYTSSPVSAIDDAGEAVDEKTQERFSKEGRESFKSHLERERRERERLKPAERLALALDDAQRRGVDVSSDLRVIEKRIGEMKRKADAA